MMTEARIEVHEDRTSITFMSPARHAERKPARGNMRVAPRKRVIAKRRTPVTDDAAEVVQALLTPAELDRFAYRLRQAATPLPPRASTARLVSALTGDRAYSVDERIRLESDALLRGIADRRRLLRDAVTAGEAGRILGRTRQAVHDRVKAGTLLAINDSGALRMPIIAAALTNSLVPPL